MGMKSRLFASAAFPLLSLSLVMQPAAASAAVAAKVVENRIATDAVAGSYQLAQETSEEELKKKAQEAAPAAEPQAPAAPKEAPAEAKPAPAAEAPKPQEAPKAEAAPEPQAEAPQKKHKSQEAAPAAEQTEAPKAETPKAEAEPRQPEAAPAQTQAEQAQPEQPAQGADKRPHGHDRKAKTGEGEEGGNAQKAGQAEQPADAAAQQPAAEAPAQPQVEQVPAAQPKADKSQPDKPKTDKPKAGKPRSEQAEPDQQKAAEPAVTEPKAAETQPAAPKSAEPAAAEQKPATDKAAAPDVAPAQPKAETQPPAVAPAQPATEQAPQTPPAKAQPQQNQQAAPQAMPDASGGQQAEQAIPAPEKVTPKELERRKQIAADPSKSTDTVVLPVENGAAVLDSDKDADRSNGQQGRRERDKQRASEQQLKVPTSDADAQALSGGQKRPPVKIEAVTSEQGRRLDRRPDFDAPDGARLGERRDDNRVILQFDNRSYVRSDDDSRFLQDGERPSYEQLSRDRYRETIDRPEGTRIVTIRNRYGDIIQRSRIDSRGREYVLYYSPELSDDPDQDYFQDPGADLPPMRLRIPVRDYIIDTSSDPDRDYYDFLREPPVEPVERVYSLNEVKYSARIRDKVRRIDLDTITFATGSAEIPMSQARTLKKVADAISEVLQKDPSETFLIEGHTDAVGSDQSNLILSDQRAESVASLLSDVYGIAPENLATQGYGERYLKVNTSGPEQENRRVTIRRVTPLVRPVASRN